MADLYLKMNYLVELSDKDMRLVCLALGGKLSKQEDIEEAQALNIRLLKAQQIRLSEKTQLIEGAIKKTKETGQ